MKNRQVALTIILILVMTLVAPSLAEVTTPETVTFEGYAYWIVSDRGRVELVEPGTIAQRVKEQRSERENFYFMSERQMSEVTITPAWCDDSEIRSAGFTYVYTRIELKILDYDDVKAVIERKDVQMAVEKTQRFERYGEKLYGCHNKIKSEPIGVAYTPDNVPHIMYRDELGTWGFWPEEFAYSEPIPYEKISIGGTDAARTLLTSAAQFIGAVAYDEAQLTDFLEQIHTGEIKYPVRLGEHGPERAKGYATGGTELEIRNFVTWPEFLEAIIDISLYNQKAYSESSEGEKTLEEIVSGAIEGLIVELDVYIGETTRFYTSGNKPQWSAAEVYFVQGSAEYILGFWDNRLPQLQAGLRAGWHAKPTPEPTATPIPYIPTTNTPTPTPVPTIDIDWCIIRKSIITAILWTIKCP